MGIIGGDLQKNTVRLTLIRQVMIIVVVVVVIVIVACPLVWHPLIIIIYRMIILPQRKQKRYHHTYSVRILSRYEIRYVYKLKVGRNRVDSLIPSNTVWDFDVMPKCYCMY